MPDNSYWPTRKPNRHPAFDYSAFGSYFVTICTEGMICSLGSVRDGIAGLSEAGCIAAECWQQLPKRCAQIALDTFVIMPNHIHALLFLRPQENDYHSTSCDFAITEIVRWFKTTSTKRIRRECRGNSDFCWQRSFYDRVVRNEREIHDVRSYILDNALNWETDGKR